MESGHYIDGPLGLGHRRLAIIDLSSAGSQPMISANNQIVLSYNGEIYNFKELGIELGRLGYQFQSQTDSEVVLNAWVEWGEERVDRFNGMFTFLYRIKKIKHFFLLGIAMELNLSIIHWGDTLFGSEQKAILEHPVARKVIDKKALLEYFTFQNIFTDHTLLENIKLLQPHQLGRYNMVKANLKIRTILGLSL